MITIPWQVFAVIVIATAAVVVASLRTVRDIKQDHTNRLENEIRRAVQAYKDGVHEGNKIFVAMLQHHQHHKVHHEVPKDPDPS